MTFDSKVEVFSRSYTYCGLYCTQKLDTGNLINKFSIAQWSNYSGGPRGPGPPEKTGGTRETSVLRGP